VSLWGDIEPEVTAILGDALTAFAEWGWHKITDDKDTESAKKAIAAIADKAKQAAIAAGLEHMAQLAGALQIPDALAKLAAGAQGVKDEWAAAEARGRARMTSVIESSPVDDVPTPTAAPDADDGEPSS
jgi:hypothetical protein